MARVYLAQIRRRPASPAVTRPSLARTCLVRNRRCWDDGRKEGREGGREGGRGMPRPYRLSKGSTSIVHRTPLGRRAGRLSTKWVSAACKALRVSASTTLAKRNRLARFGIGFGMGPSTSAERVLEAIVTSSSSHFCAFVASVLSARIRASFPKGGRPAAWRSWSKRCAKTS